MNNQKLYRILVSFLRSKEANSEEQALGQLLLYSQATFLFTGNKSANDPKKEEIILALNIPDDYHKYLPESEVDKHLIVNLIGNSLNNLFTLKGINYDCTAVGIIFYTTDVLKEIKQKQDMETEAIALLYAISKILHTYEVTLKPFEQLNHFRILNQFLEDARIDQRGIKILHKIHKHLIERVKSLE